MALAPLVVFAASLMPIQSSSNALQQQHSLQSQQQQQQRWRRAPKQQQQQLRSATKYAALLPHLLYVSSSSLSAISNPRPATDGSGDSDSSESLFPKNKAPSRLIQAAAAAASALLPPPPPGADLVTSALIARLVEAAVASRLDEARDVACRVAPLSSSATTPADWLRLLNDGVVVVGPVTVTGKEWRYCSRSRSSTTSNIGPGVVALSCRAIEATVHRCELDAGHLLSSALASSSQQYRDDDTSTNNNDQKNNNNGQMRLRLANPPARGQAMVALSAHDFDNFVAHPLVNSQRRTAAAFRGENGVDKGGDDGDNDDVAIDFLRGCTQINAGAAAASSVVFFCRHAGKKWRCALQRSLSPPPFAGAVATPHARSGGGGVVHVTAVAVDVADEPNDMPVVVGGVESDRRHDDDEDSATGAALAEALRRFFNDMVLELDGTRLSFRDLMVTSRGSGDGCPTVMVAVNIAVQKLPSRRSGGGGGL